MKVSIFEIFKAVLLAYVKAFGSYKPDAETADSLIKKVMATSFNDIGIQLLLLHN